MTAYRLHVSQRAEHDADTIYAWLAKRSVQGAVSWVAILRETLQSIVEDPQRHPHAPEASSVGADVRHAMFKTRRGHRYRVLYVIRGETVHIVAIRGSGQDLAKADDLQLP